MDIGSEDRTASLAFGNLTFVKCAESYGATGHRVWATGDLVRTPETAFRAGRVHLVASSVNSSEGTRVLVGKLREKPKGARPAGEIAAEPAE